MKRIPIICWIAAVLALPSDRLLADDVQEQEARSTAVALNLCRASFHRIRRYPFRPVLVEERERILNNLNLNEIADEEVIRLYTAVLEEIGDVQLAEGERTFIRDRYQRSLGQHVVSTAFALTSEVASAHYIAAIRTGARSWWDFRALSWQRDIDNWDVEKARMIAVFEKSSQFLDTFWRLARKRTIPDRWLVRATDLDRLEAAMAEQDLEVRLRVLRRMERFMECYPPYWYYVGRTQQALGQLFAASRTYDRLVVLADGHFRKDEMLAAALANQASIQDYLRQPSAPDTAELALTYSTDVWEVNLTSARVLARHGKFAPAEDAILRNLDVGLERSQSLIAQLLLYAEAGNQIALGARLNEPAVVRALPIPVLLRCAEVLGGDKLPQPAADALAASIQAEFEFRFGRDDLVFRAAPAWQLKNARLALIIDEQSFLRPELRLAKGVDEIRFRGIVESGTPLNGSNGTGLVTLVVHYPNVSEVQLNLERRPAPVLATTTPVSSTPATALANRLLPGRRDRFYLTSLQVGATTLLFGATSNLPAATTERPKPSDTGGRAASATQPLVKSATAPSQQPLQEQASVAETPAEPIAAEENPVTLAAPVTAPEPSDADESTSKEAD